ncbi:DUF5995 family protein [Mangrovivirga sp. M17]|uniref:DUF5995 family protein n=1 Tax=Mangrovivirga halotolerans TaxID=2993936 RepID=A0ABT3RVE5_9BACT|nr:DUF5995 family protein [Mangrovivirga halotolerans]MCX2745605.1 DUF5995 family protein [Mangrovivirga halotolerans]
MHSVEDLLDRMNYNIECWEKTSDSRQLFLRCYTMMSVNMKNGVLRGDFYDANWIAHLIVRFSEYYFEALEKYEELSPNTPEVWRQVHDSTTHKNLHVLQNLLIGVNTHINYDLPLALYDCLQKEWPSLNEDSRESRKHDYELVNLIIANTIDDVQDDIIAPLSPASALFDILLGRMDEWLLSKLLTGWRSEVWDVTQNLLQANTPVNREIIRLQQEAKVLNRNRQIIKVI